jgi:uncharacterized protein (DUF1778 family)
VAGYIIDKALAIALERAADRHVFELDDAQWTAFMAALDMPVTDNPMLRALLASKPAWER